MSVIHSEKFQKNFQHRWSTQYYTGSSRKTWRFL